MNGATKLYNAFITNKCMSLDSAIELALVSMKDNGSTCDITRNHHTFLFADKSALRLGADGIQVCDYLEI